MGGQGVQWLEPRWDYRLNRALGLAFLAFLPILTLVFWQAIWEEAVAMGPLGLLALFGILLLLGGLFPMGWLHVFWSFHRLGTDGETLLLRSPWGGVRRFRGGPEGEVWVVWQADRPVDLLAGPFLLPLRWGKTRSFAVYSPGEEDLLLRLSRPTDEAGMWAHLEAHNPLAYGVKRLFWALFAVEMVLLLILAGLELWGRFLEDPALFLLVLLLALLFSIPILWLLLRLRQKR